MIFEIRSTGNTVKEQSQEHGNDRESKSTGTTHQSQEGIREISIVLEQVNDPKEVAESENGNGQ